MRRRQRLWLSSSLILCSVIAVRCGGSSAPTPTARASVTVTFQNLTGEQTSTGFSYRFQLKLQETAGVEANISSILMTGFIGSVAVGSMTTAGSSLESTLLAANATTTIDWTIRDDRPGSAYWTMIRATVTFTDAVGTQTAVGTGNVPPLPSLSAGPFQRRAGGRGGRVEVLTDD